MKKYTWADFNHDVKNTKGDIYIDALCGDETYPVRASKKALTEMWIGDKNRHCHLRIIPWGYNSHKVVAY